MSSRGYRESAVLPIGSADHILGPRKAAIELVEYLVDVSFGLQSLADAVERTSRRLPSKRPRVALGKVH
jgi:hypothetical protein